MKEFLGGVLLSLGIFSLLTTTAEIDESQVPAAIVGGWTPGLLLMFFGGVLRRSASIAESDLQLDGASRDGLAGIRKAATLGIALGIGAMFAGSRISARGPEMLRWGSLCSLIGWSLMVWGCVNLARRKGYSGWVGFLGYLFLPGLLVLACLSNRRKRADWDADARIALAVRDQTFGTRYLLTLLPIGLLLVGVLYIVAPGSIDASAWTEVAPEGLGFRAMMPGTPKTEKDIQEVPGRGSLEIHKFTVTPRGNREIFLIVSLQFPASYGDEMGGVENVLELGRKDVVAAIQGEIKSERPIELDGAPGIELEVAPPKGAIVKVRVYAQKNQLYQVFVHVPIFRLASADVQKFFDSFQLTGR